jgi:LacI family transcriptional regulator
MPKNRRTLFVGNLNVAYNRDVLRGVAAYTAQHPDIRVFFAENFKPADLSSLVSADIHGIILGGYPPVWKMSHRIAELGIPAVDVSAELGSSCLPRVMTDDKAVGRMAADYFMDRGFRRLVYYGMVNRYWSEMRLAGFTDQATARGAQTQSFLKQQTAVEDRAGFYSVKAVSWIKKIPKPFAIYAGDDLIGSYLIEVCRQIGVRVPEDVAILGTDNDDLYGQLRTPHLSSILLDSRRIGLQAMEMLQRIVQRGTPAVKTLLIPPIKIITRLSSEIFGVEDALVRESLGLIHQNLRKGVSVKWLAHEMAISRPTLERHFIAAIGRSPAKEIQRMQMEAARHLIIDTDTPIAKVALDTGYSSPRQFSTSFHEYFNQTPRDMRKTQRYAVTTPSGSVTNKRLRNVRAGGKVR